MTQKISQNADAGESTQRLGVSEWSSTVESDVG